MQFSIRGEMTESHSTAFSHPATEIPAIQDSQVAFTALGYAITKGKLDSVKNLLDGDQFGLLGAKDYAENTALHLAAVGPEIEVLRELLERGASVHARNLAGNTPLYLATKVGNKEAMGLLEATGALLHVEEVEMVQENGVQVKRKRVD